MDFSIHTGITHYIFQGVTDQAIQLLANDIKISCSNELNMKSVVTLGLELFDLILYRFRYL